MKPTYRYKLKVVPTKPSVVKIDGGLYLVRYIGVDKAMTHRELAAYVQNRAA